MARKHLQLKPHRIKGIPEAWWYEDNGAITIIVQPHAKFLHIPLRWNAVRNAIKRKDRKP